MINMRFSLSHEFLMNSTMVTVFKNSTIAKDKNKQQYSLETNIQQTAHNRNVSFAFRICNKCAKNVKSILKRGDDDFQRVSHQQKRPDPSLNNIRHCGAKLWIGKMMTLDDLDDELTSNNDEINRPQIVGSLICQVCLLCINWRIPPSFEEHDISYPLYVQNVFFQQMPTLCKRAADK